MTRGLGPLISMWLSNSFSFSIGSGNTSRETVNKKQWMALFIHVKTCGIMKRMEDKF